MTLRRALSLLHILTQLQFVHVLLRVCSLRRIERLCIPQQPDAHASKRHTPQEYLELLDAAAWRFSWLNTCLPRSIVLCRLLRNAGHQAHLVIGARNEHSSSAGFEAHAWVEDMGGRRYDKSSSIDQEFRVLKPGSPS